jgi:hypothetical protein
MLLKPLQDADVRQAQSTAALQRDANGSASWRLNSGQCQAGRRRSNLRGSLRRGGGEKGSGKQGCGRFQAYGHIPS